MIALTYHFTRNTHLIKLLLIVRSRFGAVVGDKDELLA